MKNVSVKKISQKDNHTFAIEWNDGIEQLFRLCDLQKQCPCAGCMDEITGKRIVREETLRKDVRATRIVNVGRYALRIQFTSGCSSGIYGFDMLYQMRSSS